MVLSLLHHLSACVAKRGTEPHQKINLSLGSLQLSLCNDFLVDEGGDFDDLGLGLLGSGKVVRFLFVLSKAEDHTSLDSASGFFAVVVDREMKLSVDHAVEVTGEFALFVQDAAACKLTELTEDQQLSKHRGVVRPEELQKQTLLSRCSQIVSDLSCCTLMLS